MSPWPPEGEPSGKGTSPVHLPRPGHADLAGVLKYGHEDVRNALERASARQTAAHVAAGAVAKALLAEIGIAVAGSVREIGGATTQETMRDGDRRGARASATRWAEWSRSRRPACRPVSARTRRSATGSTRDWLRRSWASRRSRASRWATASSWRAGAGRRRTTRSSRACAEARTGPAAWRAGCRTARRFSSARR